MPLPKSYYLIHGLQEHERSAFTKTVGDNDRYRSMMTYLSTESEEGFSKESLYQQAYASVYEKSKDYLLRNDLRKFTEQLLAFIQTEVLKSDHQSDYFNWLKERRIFVLLEKELGKRLGYGKESVNTDDLRLNDLHIRHLLSHSPRLKKDFEKNLAYIKATIIAIGDQQCEEKLSIILHLAKYERIYWQHYQTPFSDLNQYILPSCLEKGKRNQYDFDKARSFQVFGNERIDLLLQCLDHVSQKDEKTEMAYIYSQLGLEYFLDTQYKEAYGYYDKARALAEHLNANGILQYVYNFASLLCRMKRFNQVVPLVESHLEAFEHTSVLDNVRIFLFFAYEDAGDHKAMRTLLPAIETGLSQDSKIYWRILECIALYEEKEWETCLTLLENIYQAARYNEHVDKAFIELSLLFRNFIKAALILDSNDKSKALQSCLEASDDFIGRHEFGFGSNMLSSSWLNDEIRGVMKA